MSSSMPPLDIDCEGPSTEHTATCPACGGECIHPYHRRDVDDYVPDEDDWTCLSCDYYYEGG